MNKGPDVVWEFWARIWPDPYRGQIVVVQPCNPIQIPPQILEIVIDNQVLLTFQNNTNNCS